MSRQKKSRVIVGENDLASSFPELLPEWDSEKNGSLSPDEVTFGNSRTEIWWKCVAYGHSWVGTPNSRTMGAKSSGKARGCPYCSGRLVLPGFNDLGTTHPLLAAQWDEAANGKTADKVLKSAVQEAYWLCDKGHSWVAKPRNRGSNAHCPECQSEAGTLSALFPGLSQEWDESKNSASFASFSYSSAQKAWWKCSKGHSWQAHIYARTGANANGCPTCSISSPFSAGEKELYDYVCSILPDASVIANDRTILNGKEVDIYIPDYKVAIEYNGLYWHSDANLERTSHHEKYLSCSQQGIQLIQIWEDDWRMKEDLVKVTLSHKLGRSSLPRVYARKTAPSAVSYSQAKTFLDSHHIQGAARGSNYLGLFHNQEMVAVMVIQKEPNTRGKGLLIARYATSQPVVGGFSKLLKYLESTLSPDWVTSFSDNLISTGELYARNGFVEERQIVPDYAYVVNRRRVHKFNYRLKRFKEDPNLKYIAGKSETELARINKIGRVWDAGKIKWSKDIVRATI